MSIFCLYLYSLSW